MNIKSLSLTLLLSIISVGAVAFDAQQEAHMRRSQCMAPSDYSAKFPLQPWCGCKIISTNENDFRYGYERIEQNNKHDYNNDAAIIAYALEKTITYEEMSGKLRKAAIQCVTKPQYGDKINELSENKRESQHNLDRQYAEYLNDEANVCHNSYDAKHKNLREKLGANSPLKDTNYTRQDNKAECIRAFMSLFSVEGPYPDDLVKIQQNIQEKKH
jgi:hypothetical protein